MSISGGRAYQAERMTGANAPGESALFVSKAQQMQLEQSEKEGMLQEMNLLCDGKLWRGSEQENHLI